MATVAIDIRSLLETNWGGVSWFTYYITTTFIKHAEQGRVQLFLFYNQRKPINKHVHDLISKWRKSQNVLIKGYKMPNRILNLMMRFLHYPYIDELILNKTNIKKINFFIIPNLSFIILSKNTKYIAVCHDISFELFPEFFTWRQKLWQKIINTQKFYKNAHKVISVSQNTKQDLIDLYKIDKNKINAIYPGIDHQKFKIIKNTNLLHKVQKKYKLKKNFILFLSTLEPRKNIETLIQAYDMLCANNQDVENVPDLIIAGAEGWKYDRIYRFWIRAKYQNKIHFIKKINNNDIASLYNLATIFIYPSFYEGFGFPPLEAMACGTPVIAGHGSSLPEVIGDAGLLIDPFNIADITCAINKLLSNKKLYDTLKKRGLKKTKKFHWNATVQNILKSIDL